MENFFHFSLIPPYPRHDLEQLLLSFCKNGFIIKYRSVLSRMPWHPKGGAYALFGELLRSRSRLGGCSQYVPPHVKKGRGGPRLRRGIGAWAETHAPFLFCVLYNGRMGKTSKEYIIGVDGGGTKTKAAIADKKGKILKTAEAGPSSPRNVGIEIAVESIVKALKKVLREGEILSTFVGLAAVEEEPSFKTRIRKELSARKEISAIFKGKLRIGSDQIAAFRSGTDKKDGLVLIAGTGCVVHGWNKEKEAHISGWGWLADEGSAFWVGQRAFRAVFKQLDGRGPKTKITEIALKEMDIKKEEDLVKKAYSKNIMEIIPMFSIYCDRACNKKDRIAVSIMKEAAGELVLATNTAIGKLNFQKKKFPLVLAGSMFNSKTVSKILKKEVKKFAPGIDFIKPRRDPVSGAVRLAIETL